MKSLLSLFIVAMLASCGTHNDVVIPLPQAKLSDQIPAEIRLGVYDQLYVTNESTNATTYLWDFGNGQTATTEHVTLQYPKSGLYTLSLTATNREGKESTITRPVKVYDYVMQSMTVKNIYINLYANRGYGPADVIIPSLSNGNFWFEIKLGQPGQQYLYTPSGDKNMPVVWKSTVIPFTDGKTADQVSFNLPDLAIDIQGLENRTGGGWGYGFNFYAQDVSGTYLLGSTYWAGTTAGPNYDQGSDKATFTMVTSGPETGTMYIRGTMELPK